MLWYYNIINKLKTVIFFLQGGIGKHIAATAVAENINKNYPDRKLIVICPYPEVFLNNPFVYRVYRSNTAQYFYEDFIKNKDVIFLGNEVYQSNEYVTSNKHLIESWCNMFGLKYTGENPKLFLTQIELIDAYKKYNRNKPILALQTNGGAENQSNYNWARDLNTDVIQEVVDELKENYHIFHLRRDDQMALKDTEKLNANWREIFCFLTLTNKRLLIDSFAQHAAAALMLPSTVCWVATSPEKLGYNIHNNLGPLEESRVFTHKIDGIILEKEFVGLPHQCDIDINKIYNKDLLIKNLV